MKKTSAGGIVLDTTENKVLLIQHRDRYGFPKGGVNPDETNEQAALREVREETGKSVCIARYLGVITRDSMHFPKGTWSEDAVGTPVQKDIVLYLMRVTEEPDIPPEDSSKPVWVDIDTAVDGMKHKSEAEFLQTHVLPLTGVEAGQHSMSANN